MASLLLFENGRLLDGTRDHATDGHLLVEGERIREVSDRPIATAAAVRLDLRGRTLMPGLIDCHVHVVASLVDLGRNALLPDALVAHRAARIMEGMLRRGFTTVRDVGGATEGLRLALDEGLFEGPRLVICGKALSQTGGHCDFRGRHDARDGTFYANRLGSIGRLVDGVDAVRRACREEIKAGADFIKVMANGGVASPTDPIDFLGFSRAELEAAVEEAAMARTYVAAHLYTDEAIRRAVACGVRSLEHCNLITPETARLAGERGAFAVPTLITYEALARDGARLGLPPESVAKIDAVRRAGLASLQVMHEAGLTMAFGTDLLGPLHDRQGEEFLLRRDVLPAIEVIRSATVHAARLLRREGEIGCLAPGAYADLIVVDGDPLADLALLAHGERHISLVVKGGRIIRNNLNG
ncbi:MAG: amidohydrolase family protein [Acetobacteraceae bacterium]|nr:amidohydrolase family protein [Acetobacteraceae bacterium]